MKFTTMFRIGVAVAAIAMSASADATTLTGDWNGAYVAAGVTATFDLTVGPQDSLDHFDGFFDWLCTSGAICSGIEYFSGGLEPGGGAFTFATTGFFNSVNLIPSSYWGTVANDGNTLIGYVSTDSTASWTANRVASVPEPAPFALLALGLILMSFTLRENSASRTATMKSARSTRAAIS